MYQAANQLEKNSKSERIAAIDALRGLVIVLMALDHSRDFFGDVRIRPESIDTTTISLFLTRWVTHICAPTFVFLAGMSAWLYGEKFDSRSQLAWYLVTRGAWLILLEFTVIRFGLMFTLTQGPALFLVIAAIGTSMILLGLCCWLPRNLVLIVGISIIVTHNILDSFQTTQPSVVSDIWTLLLRPGFIPSINMAVGYPILPWFGVMALGYGLSPFLTQPKARRTRLTITFGLAFVFLFLVLRTLDIYGEPQKWDWQSLNSNTQVVHAAVELNTPRNISVDLTRTMFSFLGTSKYPPSFLFVLMTLGPALVLLGVFDSLGKHNRLVRFFSVFGSVPLFFYVVHFYLLHLGAWGLYWSIKGVLISPMHIDIDPNVPPEYGFNGPGWLVQVYIGWAIIITILFPLCIWFRQKKRNGRKKIWSYL